MSNKKEITDEELEKVAGGFDNPDVWECIQEHDKVKVRIHRADMFTSWFEYQEGRVIQKIRTWENGYETRYFKVWLEKMPVQLTVFPNDIEKLD